MVAPENPMSLQLSSKFKETGARNTRFQVHVVPVFPLQTSQVNGRMGLSEGKVRYLV